MQMKRNKEMTIFEEYPLLHDTLEVYYNFFNENLTNIEIDCLITKGKKSIEEYLQIKKYIGNNKVASLLFVFLGDV